MPQRLDKKQLALTTRDVPDYDKLMKMRIEILKEKGYTIQKMKKIIAKMKPFDGAPEFIKWMRETGKSSADNSHGQFLRLYYAAYQQTWISADFCKYA